MGLVERVGGGGRLVFLASFLMYNWGRWNMYGEGGRTGDLHSCFIVSVPPPEYSLEQVQQDCSRQVQQDCSRRPLSSAHVLVRRSVRPNVRRADFWFPAGKPYVTFRGRYLEGPKTGRVLKTLFFLGSSERRPDMSLIFHCKDQPLACWLFRM